MAKRMSKLKAFKGRSKGQTKRRKREAVKKVLDGVGMIERDGKVRFPREER